METSYGLDEKTTNLLILGRANMHMRKAPQFWLVLLGLAFLFSACESEHRKVGEEELIAMEIKAEVESLTIDFKNLREVGVNINNADGQHIRFQSFAEWYSATPEPGFWGFAWDSGYVCTQIHPSARDSIFKPRNSRRMVVRIYKTKELDTILIVDRWRAEKVLERKDRTSEMPWGPEK